MKMNESQTPKPRPLTARRLVLLGTTIFGLSAGALLLAPSIQPNGHTAAAQSQIAARPVGFADIVERVKPAVMSVRVKMETTSQSGVDGSPFPPGSDMDQFFRRYGLPDGIPNAPRGRSYATGQGSGFFISADGYAVTNNHVVDKATMVQVTTDDGKTYPAKVIGVDQRTDLALIKVDGSNFPYVKLSDRAPRVGDWVIAVGNPFGLGGTVTAGIVSARGRDIGSGPYDDYIQIDAPVNKGNSGGPTFDVDGNVIGVNTAIFSPSGGSVGIAFAIPASTVKTVVAQLKDKGSVLRGWIGVQVQAITPEIAQERGLKRTDGALVTEPQQNGPAAKAGIEAGDVILAVNGAPVKDSRDLAKRIGNMAPGTPVKLAVLSKGTEKDVSLTLGELPNATEARAEPSQPNMQRRFRDRDPQLAPNDRDDRNGPRSERRQFRDEDRDLGPEADSRGESRSDRFIDRFADRFFDRFADRFGDRGERGGQNADRNGQGDRRADMPRLGLQISPGQNSEGLAIAAVEPDSLAAKSGFQPGDVILDVGGKTVSSVQDLRRALREARTQGQNSVTMRVKSQQGTRSITVPLTRA
jgi:serine protease Do